MVLAGPRHRELGVTATRVPVQPGVRWRAVDEVDGLRVPPRFKRALEASVREARRRGHPYLGSEHVLVGILSEPDCIAARVLADLGVADAVRQRLTGVMNLREELLRRRERDQAPMRQMRIGQPVDPDLTAQLDSTIRANTAWLGGVIQEWGWPGRSLVGDDGADAAWLLAQHSDHDPAFQRTCLDVLAAAVERGDASQRNLAYLTDRVLLKERGTQVYGTQFTSGSGGPEPQPIEDPEGVDERRAAMGLGSLAEYAELMRGQH
jgi:hypothetical protein